MVAGAEFSAVQVLWFVGAGFILGFAASTLWEWLYYRQKRNAQIEAATLALLPPVPASPQPEQQPESDAPPAEEGWKMPYRGSGIYLESEQLASSAPAASGPALSPVPAAYATNDTLPDEELDDPEEADLPEHLANPRLNPATLAALQAAVAQSPIAHANNRARIYNLPAHREPAPPAPAPSGDPDTEGESDAIQVREISTYNAPPVAALSPSEAVPEEEGDTPAPPTDHTAVYAAPPSPGPLETTDHPDDLALIRGVGEAYKRRLYNAGIYTWRQVAESDTESLRRITRAKPNANIKEWRNQARDLAEKYQRWHTTFRGPLDDLTRIDGIGAITADILYKAGLCTYDQLAGALPDELAKIVPAPTVGDENDFNGWIESAVQLSNHKRHANGAQG